jgi:hypothetical protein
VVATAPKRGSIVGQDFIETVRATIVDKDAIRMAAGQA